MQMKGIHIKQKDITKRNESISKVSLIPSELNKKLWIEAMDVSKELRDIEIKVTYGEAWDKISATAVWAKMTQALHDNAKIEDITKIWED